MTTSRTHAIARLIHLLTGCGMLVFGAWCSAAITYTYDNLNRLTGVDYGNGTTIAYTYDAAGNRLSRTVQAGPPSPPVVASVVSRKVHGAAGTFNLSLAATAADPTTEPRTGGVGGNHTIVFVFDKAVTAGTAAVTAGSGVAATPTFSGNEMIVPLSGVANAQYVSVNVSNVASADGATGGSGSVRIGFLTGDVNSSRTVTLSDLLFASAALAQPVGATNFLRDVNTSGTLTVSDLLRINAGLTQALPAP